MVASPEATLPAALKRDWDRPTVQDWVDVLVGLPLFANVGKRRLRKIAALAEVRVFEPNSVVVQAGDVADGFYVILAGRGAVFGRSRRRVLRKGDYFGEIALLDGGPRSATVRSTGELQTMRIPRRAFAQLLDREPRIARELLSTLAARLRELDTRSVA